MNYFWR